MTAAELLADPEFRAHQAAVEERLQENLETYKRHAGPLLEDLAAVGFTVETVGDLRRLGTPYPDAVPILIRWLPAISDRYVKEDIIRTLSVPWARPEAILPIVQEYRRSPKEPLAVKWAAGNALEVIADDSVFDDVVAIATDPTEGRAREMVVAALGNMKNPQAEVVLIRLLNDEAVAPYAIMGLGKMGAKAAQDRIAAFLDNPEPWVRTEARKALASIRKIDSRR